MFARLAGEILEEVLDRMFPSSKPGLYMNRRNITDVFDEHMMLMGHVKGEKHHMHLIRAQDRAQYSKRRFGKKGKSGL